MPDYRYLFYDLLTNTFKDELPLSGVKYSYVLDDSGTFFGTLPTRHAKADPNVISPGNTIIYIERDGDIVWDGILWQTQAQSGSENSTISLNGASTWSWFQELDQRGQYIWGSDRTYVDDDQLLIARDLVDYAQDIARGPQADIGVETGTELTTDNGGDEQLRTITYKGNEFQNIGSMVENLSALSNGFDFRIETDIVANEPQKKFKVFYPSAGRQTGLRFELGVNIYTYTHIVDATVMARRVFSLGAAEGDNRVVGRQDDAEFTSFPMREATFTHSSVQEQATIDAHAYSDLERVRRRREVPTLIVQAIEPPVGSYACGDLMDVVIDDGYVQVNKLHKLVQYEVRVDEEVGQEDITLRFNIPEVVET